MEAKLIDGKGLAKKIRQDLKNRIDILNKQKGVTPGLAVILVGNNPASQIYVRNKERSCNDVGIKSEVIYMDENTPQSELLKIINNLNMNERIHGILVQLPLPKHIDEQEVIKSIDPKKDVDGFHPVNVGKLLIGDNCLQPCTPKGVIRLIEETGQSIEGKKAVVIGRSNIVGKPVSLMLLQKNATVIMTHSKTQDLASVTGQADILVTAMGRPQSIDKTYVKEGAIVIDVGTTRVNNRLLGDVVYDDVKHKAAFLTPVPGGVGPMTITMLLENTILAAENYDF